MLTIRFQGRDWLFTGDSLADGGAITTADAYREGTASHAHLCRNGTVRRFGEPIGTVGDIQVLGEAEVEPDDPFLGALNIFTHPSWRGKGSP